MERITVGQNGDLITEALHIADAVKTISDDVADKLLYHIKQDPRIVPFSNEFH